MSRVTGLLGALALGWVGAAAAEEVVTPWVDPRDDAGDGAAAAALEAEIARAMGLSVPGEPRPYHVRLKWMRVASRTAIADAGAVVYRSDGVSGSLGGEVRVGGPDWDNTGFGGWQDGFGTARGPATASPAAWQRVAWRLLDGLTKDAVEQAGRKEAAATQPPDHPGDYTLVGTRGLVAPPAFTEGMARPVALPPDRAAELAAAGSAALVSAWPGLSTARAHVGAEQGRLWILDSEGGRAVRPVAETSVRLIAMAQAADGATLTDGHLVNAASPDAIDLAALGAAAGEVASGLRAAAAAPALAEEYVGPVVFEGEAAADLFQLLLLPQLVGTPAERPFDSVFGDIGERSDVRLNRRVLPAGWAVVDDPTAAPGHPAGHAVDAEGTPAQAVSLVRDGIVVALPTSRTPFKGLDTVTGHGRLRLWDRAEGRPAVTTVTPPATVSGAALVSRGLVLAKAYGLDHVVIVRRPCLVEEGGGDGPWLPPPVVIVRRFADGREELVRGAAFAAVHRYVLRDLVAAGPSLTVDRLDGWRGDPWNMDPVEGVVVRVTAPSVLVGELELVPASADPARAPRLPPAGPLPPAASSAPSGARP